MKTTSKMKTTGNGIPYDKYNMRAETEKTTFSCKDDCTLTKHTRRWTYSALRYFLAGKAIVVIIANGIQDSLVDAHNCTLSLLIQRNQNYLQSVLLIISDKKMTTNKQPGTEETCPVCRRGPCHSWALLIVYFIKHMDALNTHPRKIKE